MAIFPGTDGNDSVTTGTDNDCLIGGQGNDTLNAGDGSNTLFGGDGNDSLIAGLGADFISGGNQNDTILAAAGNDTIDAGDQRDTVSAGEGADSILGGKGEDTIDGGAGADTIDAGSDDDTVSAGDGDDFIVGGETGKDTIVGGAGNDTIDGGSDDDTLSAGEGSDRILGSSGKDTIDGASGDDTIDGGEDGDRIRGGKGFDTIVGDKGDDTFEWAPGQGSDTIDGGIDSDHVIISSPGFTPASLPTGGSGAAAGANGWSRVSGSTYNDATGATYRYAPTGEQLFLRNIESAISCFYPGTLIATPGAECAVETLQIGDLVLTSEGKAKPVRWMGRQTVSTTFGDPLRVLPVRITAGALADGVPARDLLLSPDHAVLVEGVLIQAGALVNGTTILRQFDVPEVFTYHHIELAEHDLVVAEGAPAETFVDNIDRLAFDNWAEHEALYGNEPSIPEMDLPRAKAQRQVPRFVQLALEARAGIRKTA